MTGTRLVNDIKKLSPDAQTSSLEGFHWTLNHFHPKMVCFSWLGTFCRWWKSSTDSGSIERPKDCEKEAFDISFNTEDNSTQDTEKPDTTGLERSKNRKWKRENGHSVTSKKSRANKPPTGRRDLEDNRPRHSDMLSICEPVRPTCVVADRENTSQH